MDRSSGAKPIRNPRLTASGDPPAAKDGGIAGEAGERVGNGPTRIESQNDWSRVWWPHMGPGVRLDWR